MTAGRLLNELSTHGFTVRVEGDALKIALASRLPKAALLAIRAHKPALLALLALLALVRLREAAAARVTASGHIAPDRELLALWREAIAANPGDVVTIEGQAFPKVFDASAAYDLAAAFDEAEQQLRAA